MCQIVPRLVLRVEGQRAEVDYDGRAAWVDCRPIDDLRPGEYVNVYAGVALERLTEELALELLAFQQELERLLADAAQNLFEPAGGPS
jgi:hydrogenase assembly chaperone HypC/HupF